jgi:hypothetical protein
MILLRLICPWIVSQKEVDTPMRRTRKEAYNREIIRHVKRLGMTFRQKHIETILMT